MLSRIKITSSMFPEVYHSVLREWDPSIPESRWNTAFFGHRQCDEDHVGYALTDGSKIVGMLGMIFSRRLLHGKAARFCNLHCWHVQPQYRASSLVLIKPALDLKEHTITDFTPTQRVCAISKRLGFSSLDRTAIVLPPLPQYERRRRAATCEVTSLLGRQCVEMDAADVQIYQDHQDINCGHMLVRSAGAYCYIVYSRIDKHWLPYCYVHYLSDKQLFVEHHAAIRLHLLRNTGGRYVVVDGRLLAGVKVPRTLRVRANEKLYRSTRVAPHEIDSLYSEMVFFKHSTLPSLKQRLRDTAQRCIPGALASSLRFRTAEA